MKTVKESIRLETTSGRAEFVDITEQVREIFKSTGIENGFCLVYSHHTTCSVFLQEDALDMSMTGLQTLQQDLMDVFEDMVPTQRREGQYLHPGPKAIVFAAEHDEDIRGVHNTDAHIRSMFLGRNELLPIYDGILDTGDFGHIYFVDLDTTRPRKRTVVVQIMGE